MRIIDVDHPGSYYILALRELVTYMGVSRVVVVVGCGLRVVSRVEEVRVWASPDSAVGVQYLASFTLASGTPSRRLSRAVAILLNSRRKVKAYPKQPCLVHLRN